MRFGHNAIRVKDIDTMLRFYVKGLGFAEAFKIFNDDGSLRIVYVHISQGQYLELCLGGNKRLVFDDKESIGLRHIAFTVEDIAKTKVDLESRGVVFDSEIMNMKDKNLAAYLFDPEGNKIELVQIMPESPHYQFEKSIVYEMKLQPEPFEAIRSGKKIIESRLYDEKRQQIQIGDKIVFKKNPDLMESVTAHVVGLLRYPSFELLFSDFDPGWFGGTTKIQLLEQIRKFYSEEEEKKCGVVGIKILLTKLD